MYAEKFTIILHVLILTTVLAVDVAAQSTRLTCGLTMGSDYIYTCLINGQIVVDDENQEFEIIANHWEGRNDSTVTGLRIGGDSNIPFIIPQLFERFPNIRRFVVRFSGLKRIQSNAFRHARNLEIFISAENPMHTIQRDAFVGAVSMRTLDFRFNKIQVLSEDSFNGLTNLRDLLLEQNRIRRLPNGIFRPLKNVEMIHLSENRIEVIDANLFATNHQVREISFMQNRINEIGRKTFEGLRNLQVINVLRNRCAHNFWIVGGTNSIASVLGQCFENFEATRRLRVEVRGTAKISDDYGNEILSI